MANFQVYITAYVHNHAVSPVDVISWHSRLAESDLREP